MPKLPKIKDVDHFYYSQSEISNPQWIHFTSRPNDLPAPFPVFRLFTFDLCPMPYAFQFRIPHSDFKIPTSAFRLPHSNNHLELGLTGSQRFDLGNQIAHGLGKLDAVAGTDPG